MAGNLEESCITVGATATGRDEERTPLGYNSTVGAAQDAFSLDKHGV